MVKWRKTLGLKVCLEHKISCSLIFVCCFSSSNNMLKLKLHLLVSDDTLFFDRIWYFVINNADCIEPCRYIITISLSSFECGYLHFGSTLSVELGKYIKLWSYHIRRITSHTRTQININSCFLFGTNALYSPFFLNFIWCYCSTTNQVLKI